MLSICSKLTRPVNFSIMLLLLIGYVLMGWMMAEQNRAISAQRELIQKLFQDSVQLSITQLRQNQQQQRQRR
jgi:Tfp pilus assembly protein PilN